MWDVEKYKLNIKYMVQKGEFLGKRVKTREAIYNILSDELHVAIDTVKGWTRKGSNGPGDPEHVEQLEKIFETSFYTQQKILNTPGRIVTEECSEFVDDNIYQLMNVTRKKWNDILTLMRIENEISNIAYETWVQFFCPCKMVDNILFVLIDKENLIVPVDWFSKKYRFPLINAIAKVTGRECEIKFVIPHDEYVYERRKVRRTYELSE